MANLPGATDDHIRLLNIARIETVGDLLGANLSDLEQELAAINSTERLTEQAPDLSQLFEWQNVVIHRGFSPKEVLAGELEGNPPTHRDPLVGRGSFKGGLEGDAGEPEENPLKRKGLEGDASDLEGNSHWHRDL